MQTASIRITVVLFVPPPPHSRFVLSFYFLTSFFLLIAYSYLSLVSCLFFMEQIDI